MSIITNTFTSSDAKGLRESLSEVIYNISPTDFPVTSMASKGKAEATLVEWQIDSLRSANTGNAQLEGDQFDSFGARVPTSRIGNHTQILRDLFVITATEEAVSKAGRKSEVALQTAKAGKEIRKDLEAIVCENIGAVGGQTRKMGTLGAFVKTNVNKEAGGTNPVYTSVPTDPRNDGTPRAFTETILKDVMQQCYASGAEPKDLIVDAVNMDIVASFQGIATATQNLDKGDVASVLAAVDLYKSNFGTLRVRPSRHVRATDAWFLDREFIGLQHLRPFTTENLPKTADGHQVALLAEVTLAIKNEAALGLAADLGG